MPAKKPLRAVGAGTGFTLALCHPCHRYTACHSPEGPSVMTVEISAKSKLGEKGFLQLKVSGYNHSNQSSGKLVQSTENTHMQFVWC